MEQAAVLQRASVSESLVWKKPVKGQPRALVVEIWARPAAGGDGGGCGGDRHPDGWKPRRMDRGNCDAGKVPGTDYPVMRDHQRGGDTHTSMRQSLHLAIPMEELSKPLAS
jgi:hypothetical protein